MPLRLPLVFLVLMGVLFGAPVPLVDAAPPGRGGVDAPVPVAMAKAVRTAAPVVVKTVGAAQAVATALLRSRMDGEIVKVHVKDGDSVQKGDRLFSLDNREPSIQLRQAEANLARDRASLNHARLELQRLNQLTAKELASRQQADKARSEVEMLDAAILGDEAKVAEARLRLTYTEITSPFSGRIGSIALREGNMARSSDPNGLAVVNQIRPIQVAFAIPQRHLPSVRQASTPLPVAIHLQGDAAAPISGRVVFVDNAVDGATGTIRLRAEVANDHERLWPGQLVEVVLTLRVDADVVVIPAEAVMSGQKGSYVYVVTPENTVQSQLVTVDRVYEGQSVITQGLTGDETVVTSGQFKLAPNRKVTNISANKPSP